jgi:hypothetical protein
VRENLQLLVLDLGVLILACMRRSSLALALVFRAPFHVLQQPEIPHSQFIQIFRIFQLLHVLQSKDLVIGQITYGQIKAPFITLQVIKLVEAFAQGTKPRPPAHHTPGRHFWQGACYSQDSESK